MVEGLIKIAGSLFIGGIGLVLILISTLILVVIAREVVGWLQEKLWK